MQVILDGSESLSEVDVTVDGTPAVDITLSESQVDTLFDLISRQPVEYFNSIPLFVILNSARKAFAEWHQENDD